MESGYVAGSFMVLAEESERNEVMEAIGG